MNRWMAAALSGAVMVGCGASNDGVTAADSGTVADTGVGATVDAGTPTDQGSATTDRGSTTTDRGSTPRDTGPSANFGTCGEAVARQVCMCGQTDNVCQSRALGGDMGCAQCLIENQAACCPTQAMALQTCIMAANDTCMGDPACLQRTCMTQVAAMQTCQMSRLQMEAMAGSGACLSGYIGCIGVLAQGFGSCP